MARESSDPTVIRSVAVSAGDVVAALEANRRGEPRTVLRVTPPFSGRMRARLHRPGPGPGESDAVHLDPESLVSAAAPAYPGGDGDPSPDAVADWRAAVREHVVETTALPVSGGGHEVAVSVLG